MKTAAFSFLSVIVISTVFAGDPKKDSPPKTMAVEVQNPDEHPVPVQSQGITKVEVTSLPESQEPVRALPPIFEEGNTVRIGVQSYAVKKVHGEWALMQTGGGNTGWYYVPGLAGANICK